MCDGRLKPGCVSRLAVANTTSPSGSLLVMTRGASHLRHAPFRASHAMIWALRRRRGCQRHPGVPVAIERPAPIRSKGHRRPYCRSLPRRESIATTRRDGPWQSWHSFHESCRLSACPDGLLHTQGSLPTMLGLGVSTNSPGEVRHATHPAIRHKPGRTGEASDRHRAGTGRHRDIGRRRHTWPRPTLVVSSIMDDTRSGTRQVKPRATKAMPLVPCPPIALEMDLCD